MTRLGWINVDISQSSLLKRLKNSGSKSAPLENTFKAYHKTLEDAATQHLGKRWAAAGDGAIYHFPSINKAVDAAVSLLEGIGEVNRAYRDELKGVVLFTRIGVHGGDESLLKVAENERETASSIDLDTLGKLQKYCPLGRMALSSEAYEALTFRRPLFRPSLIEAGIGPIFVLAERLIAPQEEDLFRGMQDAQRRAMPPFPFLAWESIRPDDKVSIRTVSKNLDDPLLIILGESSEERGVLARAATSDAVGLMEAMAAQGANDDVRVSIDAWSDTSDLVADRHVIIVGSGIVNAYSFAINNMMEHLRFIKSDGRVFSQIEARANNGYITFGTHAEDEREVGFVSVCKSPFNPSKILIWIAGINGMATQAAALFWKDLVIDANKYLHEQDFEKSMNPIACVVAPVVDPADGPLNLMDYYQRWRIKRYEVIWAIDNLGRRVKG